MQLTMSPLLTFAFAGVTFLGILLLWSGLLKLTGGRFWSLPFSLLLDPERDAAIGEQLRRVILQYVPLPFICFLGLFLYLLWR